MYIGVTPFLEMIQLVESGRHRAVGRVPAGRHARRSLRRRFGKKEPTRTSSTSGRSCSTSSCRGGTPSSSRQPGSIRKSPQRPGTSTSRTRRRCRQWRRAVRLHLRLPRLAVAAPDHPLDQHRRLRSGDRALHVEQRSGGPGARDHEADDAAGQPDVLNPARLTAA